MRFFFHIHNEDTLIDHEGTEIASISQARAEAVILAGALIRDMAGAFWRSPEWKLEVTDENRLTLFTLYFNGAMAPAVR